jgi:hypothetical protein
MSISPQEELEQKVFLVRDDQAAEWCMKKIREAEAEYNRMEEWYDMQIQKARERCESTVNYMTTLLQDYFSMVPVHETKTMMKYQLPSGELVLSKAKDDYKAADNEKLLSWCVSNDPELVKVSTSPKWADIKKRLTTVDGKIVDKETGLFVDGVEIEHKEAKFEVKAGV